MATQNFFALLGDDENDDPMALVAKLPVNAPAKEHKAEKPAPAKLPTKPLPPAQSVREARTDGGRGRGGRRGGGFPRGRGSYGYREREGGENGFQGDRGDYNERNNRNDGDFRSGKTTYGDGLPTNGDLSAPPRENGGGRPYDGGRGRGRGRGRMNGFVADGEEQPARRVYERRSGTGRGNEFKRDGAGRGNWGVEVDQTIVQEVAENATFDESTNAVSDLPEKKQEEDTPADHEEKKEPEEEEDKEMTLDEYEKVLEEKRKSLLAQKSEIRKVVLDRDFESMQLVDKKTDDEVFLKLGSEKSKKKEVTEKEDRVRKSVSINEFLKPAEGEEYYGQGGRRGGGRGGGRGRGDRGGFRGGYRSSQETAVAPRIADPGHFPTLGAL